MNDPDGARRRRQIRHLAKEIFAQKSTEAGIDRRTFLRSSIGFQAALSALLVACNQAHGKPCWEVEPPEAPPSNRWPLSDYFVLDARTHFSGVATVELEQLPFFKNLGIDLEDDSERYGFANFILEMFVRANASMVVLSGVPSVERHRDAAGGILQERERTPGLAVLPSWLVAKRKQDLNEIAWSERALCQGNCAPNHYRNSDGTPDWPRLSEQMEREVKEYHVDSWMWYCHEDPAQTGVGFRLDDEKLTYRFYEKSAKLGIRTFWVHKGLASHSKHRNLAHPADVERAALDHRHLIFVVGHSGLKHGPADAEFRHPEFFDPETGKIAWHDELMQIKARHPEIRNIYCEIGSIFCQTAIYHPELAMHLIGRALKIFGPDHVVWASDALWSGAAGWMIGMLERFQISDELCEKFGYPKITNKMRAQIFGLNAARIYGIDVETRQRALQKDKLTRMAARYL